MTAAAETCGSRLTRRSPLNINGVNSRARRNDDKVRTTLLRKFSPGCAFSTKFHSKAKEPTSRYDAFDACAQSLIIIPRLKTAATVLEQV